MKLDDLLKRLVELAGDVDDAGYPIFASALRLIWRCNGLQGYRPLLIRLLTLSTTAVEMAEFIASRPGKQERT